MSFKVGKGIHDSAGSGDLDAVKVSINSAFVSPSRGEHPHSALSALCFSLQRLVLIEGVDVNLRDEDDRTPLHWFIPSFPFNLHQRPPYLLWLTLLAFPYRAAASGHTSVGWYPH